MCLELSMLWFCSIHRTISCLHVDFECFKLPLLPTLRQNCERFEPRTHFKSTLCLIVRVNVILNSTVVVDIDWRFDNLCGGHLQSQSGLYNVSWWYYTLVIDLIGQLVKWERSMASRWLTFRRSVIIYLFICLLFNHLYQDPLQCTCKIAGLSLEGLFEAKFISGASYITSSRSVRKSANSSVMATSRKLIITSDCWTWPSRPICCCYLTTFLRILGRWRWVTCCIRQKIQVFLPLIPTNWLAYSLDQLTSRLPPATLSMKFYTVILT